MNSLAASWAAQLVMGDRSGSRRDPWFLPRGSGASPAAAVALWRSLEPDLAWLQITNAHGCGMADATSARQSTGIPACGEGLPPPTSIQILRQETVGKFAAQPTEDRPAGLSSSLWAAAALASSLALVTGLMAQPGRALVLVDTATPSSSTNSDTTVGGGTIAAPFEVPSGAPLPLTSIVVDIRSQGQDASSTTDTFSFSLFNGLGSPGNVDLSSPVFSFGSFNLSDLSTSTYTKFSLDVSSLPSLSPGFYFLQASSTQTTGVDAFLGWRIGAVCAEPGCVGGAAFNGTYFGSVEPLALRIEAVPAPLPLLGFSALFATSGKLRRLRKRLKAIESPVSRA